MTDAIDEIKKEIEDKTNASDRYDANILTALAFLIFDMRELHKDVYELRREFSP